MVKQVSVFLENRAGRLSEAANLLAKNNINIRALSLADTSDFGILRLIVNNPEQAIDILRKENFTVSSTEVIALEVSDKPGGLAKTLNFFEISNINIEYMYAFLGKNPDKAIMIFRFDDNISVMEKLKGKDIKLVDPGELYSL